MKEILLESPTVIDEAETGAAVADKKRLRRWKMTLFCSISAGILSALTGLLLGAISYLGLFDNANAVNQAGNLMIIAAFPLMMLGAHALDKINEIKFSQKQS
jgi:hypothetical protein